MKLKSALIVIISLSLFSSSITQANAARPVDSTVVAVDELSDLSGDEWAYQAIKSLVEKYDVLEGYPSGIFNGNRKPSRYEMAQALYDLATYFDHEIALDREDLAKLAKLLDQYSNELKQLQARVDKLEQNVNSNTTRISTLEGKVAANTNKLSQHDQEIKNINLKISEHDKRLAYVERRKGFFLERLVKGLVIDVRDVSRGMFAAVASPFNSDLREAIRK